MANNPLLTVRDLSVTFHTPGGVVEAVRGISFDLDKGETLALVGESGSGKSVTALSVLQLLPYPIARHGPGSSITLDGVELIGAAPAVLRRIRGNRIAMVFQEPMTSLNPLHTIAKQVTETLHLHKHMGARAARRAVELLHLVGLAEAESRLDAYPHQLSGGQRQRVMIAMALANEPDILIADEPTTALDVTIQAQILKLLKDLQARFGMALLLITHDLTIVRKMADRVAVMTEGRIVERRAPSAQIFRAPAARLHPPSPRRRAQGRADHGHAAAAGAGRNSGAQSVVPDPHRRAAPHDRPHQGGGRHRLRRPRRRDAGRGRRKRLGQDDAGPRAAAPHRQHGRDPL